VPVCAVIVAVGWRLLRESKDPDARRIPDPLEALLVAAVPAALSFAIIEGPGWGWSDPRVIGGFALAAVLLPVFGWRTLRSATPVMDPALFRIRQFRITNVATVLFATAFYAYLFGNVLFLQTVWHYSVLRAALALAPSPLLVTLIARYAGRLAGRVGYRPVLITGAAVYAAGIGWFALFVTAQPHWLTHWLPGAILTGIGIGMTLPVQSAAATQHLPPARYAVGSAVNSSFRQLGAVLGISVFVAVLGTTTVAGYHRVWWVVAALGLAAGLVWLLPTRRHTRHRGPLAVRGRR
jgi:predicted MFS family arabinose efflux permease